jgi:hypothetical protein
MESNLVAVSRKGAKNTSQSRNDPLRLAETSRLCVKSTRLYLKRDP